MRGAEGARQKLYHNAIIQACKKQMLCYSLHVEGCQVPDSARMCVCGNGHSWPNVYTNLKNIDYCTDQFNYIT